MSNALFTPIEPNAAHWPISKLHQHQKAFLQEVVERTILSLRTRYATDTALYHMLTQTTAKELARIAADRWVCDPPDDQFFWEDIENALIHKVDATLLLNKIASRYVNEISSDFSVTHYKWVSKGVHTVFTSLLKPSCFKFKGKRWISKHKRLHEKLHITGALDSIHALAQIGTIVLVPTHTSNWDSVVIGLAMQQLGLSPLSWGAGLNLFNHKGFRHIFSKLGTYKIDRRKKNIPYLLAQKHYTRLTVEWHCPTLFYPAGTRSRSGTIESNLKLGLLGTPFEAQAHTFQQYGPTAHKIFMVPVVLNYHCVLEAPQLIQEWIHPETAKHVAKRDCCYSNLSVSKKILCKGSEIFLNIGTPLDVMGNKVDKAGRSYHAQGQEIDLYQQFLKLAGSTTSKQSGYYLKILSHTIVDSYSCHNLVVSSHLVAFVAYKIAQGKEDFSMHSTTTIKLVRASFMVALEKVYQALQLLYEQKKIDFTALVRKSHLPAIVADGLAKLGVYHAKTPLVAVKNGDFLIQDLPLLYYYHNRLTGYGLEQLFLA
ncbi:1-acyl-sn-glycerol-3-phosphate acyltransferase [Candidatus Cardinium hertigii]|uniref:Glycerol-3-phosphate acyltransferase n=1 Tax=Candidatus Cardinium hertigii TaxID=247481 RepID=A0A2Z3LGM2_9BACT|nr:1-acyl-sn-glycerol-3-phosphate acyltransferase [Candidatus Cardinium hertigii]AWN81534.1 Glycerol-3-phosphate acyltransferase [Candidatus Cardinium hertigii]